MRRAESDFTQIMRALERLEPKWLRVNQIDWAEGRLLQNMCVYIYTHIVIYEYIYIHIYNIHIIICVYIHIYINYIFK